MEPHSSCRRLDRIPGSGIVLGLGKPERIILSGGIKHQRVMAALLDDTPTVEY